MTQFLSAELYASASVASGSGNQIVLTIPLTTAFGLSTGQWAFVDLQVMTSAGETFDLTGQFVGGNLFDPFSTPFSGTDFVGTVNGSSDYDVALKKGGSSQTVFMRAKVRLFGTGYST